MKIRKKIVASICVAVVLVSGTVIYAAADGENNHNRSFWREDVRGSYSSGVDAIENGSVWKSNGTIEFVDGNNTLVFDPADLKTIGEELRAINDDDIAQKKALARMIVEMANQLNQTIDHYGEDSRYKVDVSEIDMNNPSVSELEEISKQMSNNYSAYYDIINSQIDEINSNINTLKKSVADGKSAIASAITSKGVSTAADATFAVMANNISKLSIGGTYLGTTDETVGGSVSFNVASKRSDYKNLTNNSFITCLYFTGKTSSEICEGRDLVRKYSFPTNSHSYNSETGILTVSQGYFICGSHNSAGYGVDYSYYTASYVYVM